MPAVARAW